MKYKAIYCVVLVASLACSQSKTLHEQAFQKQQEKIMDAHKELLVKAGRITDAEHFDSAANLGTYGWYSGICDGYGHEKPSSCYFGAYTFSEAAFQQAKELYVIRGQMEGGSDLLVDVGAGAFDKDVVGHKVGYLTYCQLTGGKLRHCGDGFKGGKVVEFIDAHTVRLDAKAKFDAEMYGLTITPPNYVDMCACTTDVSSFQGPDKTVIQNH